MFQNIISLNNSRWRFWCPLTNAWAHGSFENEGRTVVIAVEHGVIGGPSGYEAQIHRGDKSKSLSDR